MAGAVDFTYDNALRLQSILVNGDPIAGLSYDRDGLPITNGFLSMRYRADNGFMEQLFGVGHFSTWAYDSLGQVSTYAVVNQSSPTDTTFGAAYAYDQLGRITSVRELIRGDTSILAYDYDVAGRLKTVTKSGAVVEAYDYDLNGNRTRATYPGQTIVGTYDAQDRLLSYGAATFAYTGNGEIKRKVSVTDSTKYRYDALGNLRDVWLSNGDHIEYVIDAQQRRIGRKVNGTLTQGWLYQGQLAIAAEVDVTGAVTKTFEYATHGNVPDRMQVNGSVYRLVTDHLGSVRLVVDPDGNVIQRIDYDAFGRVILNTNPGFQPFGYAGGIIDDKTGLTRFGTRDYDASTGRWTAKDVVGFHGGTANLYVYVNGDPITFADPFGLTEVQFHDDPNGVLKANWEHAKRVLAAASDGNAEARGALYNMLNLERSTDVFVFHNQALGGGLGSTSPDGHDISIDICAIGEAREYDNLAVSIGSTMVHEAGHAGYKTSKQSQLNYQTDVSANWAMSADNAYRRAVNMPFRDDHHSYPRRR